MKNIFITLFVSVLCVTGVFGQDSVYVYKNGIINPSYSNIQVDNITFSNDLNIVEFNKNGLVFNEILISNVDSITFVSPHDPKIYTDIDGNTYTTVKIGTQTWMVENLKTTRFRNGDIIPMIADNSTWSSTDLAAYCDYDNDAMNGTTYGHLYNWHAATDSRIIAPPGWHVPSAAEWDILKDYLVTNGHNYIKEDLTYNHFAKSIASRTLWQYSARSGAPGYIQSLNNATGFTALPGGLRHYESGKFISQAIGSYFWTTTESTNLDAEYRSIYYDYDWLGVYGDSKRIGFSIRCIKSDLASLITNPITDITSSSATSGGDITADGNDPILVRGICWDTITNPTILQSFTVEGDGKGWFSSQIQNLLPGREYYVRAYATNTVGTAYGNELVFTTLKTKPVISTFAYTELTFNSVKTVTNIASAGGAEVTARGVCWSKNPNPVVETDSIDASGAGLGLFENIIQHLESNTRYYIRAYATNSEGTQYSDEVSIVTLPSTLPELVTIPIDSITITTATSGGEINTNGGDSIISKGVCWSLNPAPIVQPDSMTIDGIGSESFVSNIVNLTPGTTYYVRAYATNSNGTAYGEELTFTTKATTPTVSTVIISAITIDSAISGGMIVSDGGALITNKGVCWSINENPTIETDDKTTDGTGSEAFASILSGLLPATTYNVRAYATNSEGTAYGSNETFATPL